MSKRYMLITPENGIDILKSLAGAGSLVYSDALE